VVATQRPRLTYIEKDSLGVDKPPVIVLGNTIIGEGDSTFIAIGDVRIERTDVLATGDSAMVDGARRYSRLMKGPVVESKSDRPFTLKGRVIDMYGESKQLDRVVAIDSASAVSEDFNVVSDTIDLRMAEQQLNRAFAFGPAGARATTRDRDIIADSLDILMPGQKIRELRAVGKAFAESDPDTTKIKSEGTPSSPCSIQSRRRTPRSPQSASCSPRCRPVRFIRSRVTAPATTSQDSITSPAGSFG
jgi:hypothetical protein